jgi:hypothetical protein
MGSASVTGVSLLIRLTFTTRGYEAICSESRPHLSKRRYFLRRGGDRW